MSFPLYPWMSQPHKAFIICAFRQTILSFLAFPRYRPIGTLIDVYRSTVGSLEWELREGQIHHENDKANLPSPWPSLCNRTTSLPSIPLVSRRRSVYSPLAAGSHEMDEFQ